MMPSSTSCRMNETRLEVADNYEEADLSDVEDDIFVRSGGRNGYRVEYDMSKKPLMTPRKKNVFGFDNLKNGGLHTEVRTTPPTLRVLCMPMCYILIATFSMLGLVTVITFLTSYVSWPQSILKIWKKDNLSVFPVSYSSFLPCDNIQVSDVWIQQFPKLLTESSFRLVDVNKDGVDDIIFGYATGADGYGVPSFICDIYFGGQQPCLGGVMALDGRNGKELWRHWTDHEVFAVNCNEDITQDRINDCLIGGRAGVFCAISGKDGSVLWTFGEGPAKNPIMNIYTSQFIRDLNGDGVLEILAIHGGDPLAEPGSTTRLSGRIMIVSGRTGEVLQFVGTPDGRESYYSPQILTSPDGTDFVLFGTGGETHGGGLYIMPLLDLYKGNTDNVKVLYKDDFKGIMVPPVLTDINGDQVEDIVMAMFNSSVVAFDGTNFNQIWNYTFPSSETYTTPTPGYFTEDGIPDFLVKYQFGPGFPIYHFSQTTVLDGKSGQPILDTPIIDTIGSQASTPLIRSEGYGNDIFLYWSSNCKGFEGNSSQKVYFAKGTTVHQQSRADFCKLRFNSKMINQLKAFTRSTGLPGTIIYDSEQRAQLEYNNTSDTSLEGQAYLRQHPEMWQYLESMKTQDTRNPGSDIIPNYPAASNNVNLDIGQQLPPVYGQLYPGVYSPEFPSQPELLESIKYPSFHNVRKHGPIHINRRTKMENNNLWPYADSAIQIPLQGGGNEDINQGIAQQQPIPRWRRRRRRHIGPHDMDGIQRLISTGTLASPLNASDEGIDLVFATYWFLPAKPQAILPRHQECIQEKLLNEKQRFDETSKYYGMDHDQYEDTITTECISQDEESDSEPLDTPQSSYNPFDLNMGQMSVYRLHITCSCSETGKKKCAKILPMKEQPWSGYMGSRANSHFPQKTKVNLLIPSSTQQS